MKPFRLRTARRGAAELSSPRGIRPASGARCVWERVCETGAVRRTAQASSKMIRTLAIPVFDSNLCLPGQECRLAARKRHASGMASLARTIRHAWRFGRLWRGIIRSDLHRICPQHKAGAGRNRDRAGRGGGAFHARAIFLHIEKDAFDKRLCFSGHTPKGGARPIPPQPRAPGTCRRRSFAVSNSP